MLVVLLTDCLAQIEYEAAGAGAGAGAAPMAGDGIILIDLTLADFWLQRLHIDYRPLNRLVCSL